MHDNDERIAALTVERQTMLVYLKQKVKVDDWHGVADAAMDLREIDRELKTRRTFSNA